MFTSRITKTILSALISLSALSSTQFNLYEAKSEIASNNKNVAIAYENYVIAQKEARAKTLQLLPSLSVDIFLFDYQYLALRTIIPEPTRFFTAAASKELVGAASLNRLIVRRNLLEDFEKNYFLLQMHNELLPSYAKELEILKELETDTLEAYDLGAVDFSEYYQAKRAVLSAETAYLNATQLVESEELAMKLILEVPSSSDITFEYENFYNANLGYPETSEEGEVIAVNNSKEIASFDYSIRAAQKAKQGVAISWLSWGGVGLDYFSRVAIAKSNIRKIQNEKTKAVYETRNQVSALYELIDNQKKKIVIQGQLVEMAEENYLLKVDQYTDLRGTNIQVKKAELGVLASKRELLSLRYELEILYISLKRVLGATMISNEIPRA